jgi:hypothetical protein
MARVRSFSVAKRDNVDDVLDLLVYADELRVNPEKRKLIRSNLDLQIALSAMTGGHKGESLAEALTINDSV